MEKVKNKFSGLKRINMGIAVAISLVSINLFLFFYGFINSKAWNWLTIGVIFQLPAITEIARSILDWNLTNRFLLEVYNVDTRTTDYYMDYYKENIHSSIYDLTLGKKKKQKDNKNTKCTYCVVGNKYTVYTDTLPIRRTHCILGFGSNLVLHTTSDLFINNSAICSMFKSEALKPNNLLRELGYRIAYMFKVIDNSAPKESLEIAEKVIEYYDTGLRRSRINIGKTVKQEITETTVLQTIGEKRNTIIFLVLIAIIVVLAILYFL